MGCCYLLKIALRAGFTNGSLLSTVDIDSMQAGFKNGLLLSTEDNNAGRVNKWVAAIN